MDATISLKTQLQTKIQAEQCEMYCLIWLDTNTDAQGNQKIEQKLRSIINYLKKFQAVKPCQEYIKQSSETDRLVLIVSGQLGQKLVPNIHALRQVMSIYIFCMNKEFHKQWSSGYPKVKAVLSDLDALITQLGNDHNIEKKTDEPLLIDIFTVNAGTDQSTMDVNGQFVFSQVLFDCLLRLKPNQKDKVELINWCKSEHKGNDKELKNIHDFEQKYTSEKALRWYTRDTFFYKSLNSALRKQNIHIIFLFREFISDIQRQLQKYQSNKVLKVYRGQMMSSEELERLTQSIGKLISINSFFSTTSSHAQALTFLRSSRGLQPILFEIKADPNIAVTKPFADVSAHSDYPEEAEVLFMIGSIFRLDSIQSNDRNISIIKMTLCSDEQHGLKQVLLCMKGQIESGETNLRTFGKCLWKMGKLDLAEKYFLRFLKELQSDDPLTATLYEDLADLAALRGDFDTSVRYQQKAIDLKGPNQVNDTKSPQMSPNASTPQATTKSRDQQQHSSGNETSDAAAKDIETQQFQQWLEEYIKQYVKSFVRESSTRKRYPKSVENFCYIFENQLSITDDEEQMLRGLINVGFKFDDINSDECIKLVRGIYNEKIILILTKTSMENLAKSIREEVFLSAIYVIDSSRENSFDSKVYRGSFSSVGRLCKQLENDLPLLAFDLTLMSSIPAGYNKISTFNYVQTLKDILLEKDEKQNLKKEMIDFCREKYADNAVQLKLIKEFENNFQPDNAIQWYSRHETFVNKMLTRAFRILDVDILYNLRYFIQYLHRQLQSSNDKSPLTVYRVLRVRKDLFNKMTNYQDGLLSFNEFLFVNKNQSDTVPFPMNMDSKLVHFQINLGAGVPRCAIAGTSNELLLTVGTVFHIDKLESIDEETFTVKLTTTADIQKAGQAISKDLCDAVRGSSPLLRILKLMKYKELTEYMAYFAAILMNDPETPKNETANLLLGGVFHSLGGHCYETRQYEEGLTHLQKALDIYRRVLPSNDTRLTPTYNNIGSIYFRQNSNEKALEYHRKAYEIQKNSNNPDMESVLAYVGNIAQVLDRLGRYKEAIKYYEMDLKIRLKMNTKGDNPDIAVKYHNLAGRQYRAQLYSEAVENYQKCLDIELRCHSAENPTVAVTYQNMATALEKLGRLQEAKAAVEKAIERLLRTKEENDEAVQTNRKYLQQLEKRMWMKDLLAST